MPQPNRDWAGQELKSIQEGPKKTDITAREERLGRLPEPVREVGGEQLRPQDVSPEQERIHPGPEPPLGRENVPPELGRVQRSLEVSFSPQKKSIF
jgi:hypothetical protein